ncbi:kelch-like protein 10 [Pungitius pungitius]|uniref:kelch-like protein 10 n=1 Tax=Pungitius pungitius TaxID=134920 RepID=UPI002E159522
MSVYNELRLEQQLCDAVIRVGSTRFPVHKIVLCNCSPYFQALFTNWSTQERQVFDIPNVSSDVMKIIIEFAYTAFPAVTPENIQESFIAAHQFNVMGLIQACCSLLEDQLSPQNCIGIWRFTDFYYTPELTHKAFLYTVTHFEEVASTSEEFPLLSVQELVKIIENDHLNVKQEKTVFGAILCWIGYAAQERREHISLLLSNVRLALTSPQFITNSVRNNELVLASSECHLILSRALEAMHDLNINKLSKTIYYNRLSCPRLSPTALLSFGGRRGGYSTDVIEAYDTRADRWVSVSKYGAYIPRAYHATVFLDGAVYCVGGFDNSEWFSSVYRYDLVTHTWTEVKQMHRSRCYVSVTVMDGYIYAMGGYNGRHRLKSAERYQPRNNQWTLIPQMHERRSDASCTNLRGKVYICGGFNGNNFLSTAECFNPETNQWTRIASMDQIRSGVGVIAYADKVFAVGGYNGISRLNTAEAYNPDTKTWHAVPSMLACRSNFGIAVIDDRVFVAGGYSGSSTMFDVEYYDAETSEWSGASSMKVSCSALSCCVVHGLPNMVDYSAPRLMQCSDADEDKME